MSTEFGVFNNEGLIEGGFWSELSANSRVIDLRQEYDDEEVDHSDVYFAEVCLEHEDQPAESCEICWAEDEEEDES